MADEPIKWVSHPIDVHASSLLGSANETFNGVPIKWVENLADAPLTLIIQERLTIDDLKTGCRYNNAALDDRRRQDEDLTQQVSDVVLWEE